MLIIKGRPSSMKAGSRRMNFIVSSVEIKHNKTNEAKKFNFTSFIMSKTLCTVYSVSCVGIKPKKINETKKFSFIASIMPKALFTVYSVFLLSSYYKGFFNFTNSYSRRTKSKIYQFIHIVEEVNFNVSLFYETLSLLGI